MEEIKENAFYSTGEVLKILNISRETLYRYRKTGAIPEPCKIGRQNRYKGADLIKALDGTKRGNNGGKE